MAKRTSKLLGILRITWLCLISIAALLALTISAFLFYHYCCQHHQKPNWQQLQQQQDLGSKLHKLKHQNTQIKQLATKTAQLEHALHQHQQQSSSQNSAKSLALSAVQANLAMAQSAIAASANPDNIANALMQTASLIPNWHGQSQPLRQLLAQNQADLNALPKLETDQALTRLQHIDQQLPTLKIGQTPTTNKQAAKPISWRQPKVAAHQLWHKLRSLVVVQDNDQLSNKLITKADRINALALMHLQIKTATWYAITQSSSYRPTIQSLIDNIQKFTKATKQQQQIITELTSLKQYNISYPKQQLAAITQSLNQAQQLAQRLQSQG